MPVRVASRLRCEHLALAGVALAITGCLLDATGQFAAATGAVDATGTATGVGGSSQGGASQGGAAAGCMGDDDCASSDPCAVPRCVLGACALEPAPIGVACRPSVGACDIPEACDGVGLACPVDAVEPAGTACRPTAGVCDAAESCDGIDGQCPADAVLAAGSECRAAAGACDLADVCDGTSVDCPADARADSNVVCRAATNACDAGESCGGSAECPPDSGAVALCTPSLPVTWNAFERNYKVTSVNVAGTGGPTAVVAPGAAVSLVVSGSWQRVGNASCPGCITQLYFAMNGGFTSCVVTSNASGTFTKTINFTAPMAPGSYVVNPEGSWEYNCLANVTTGSTFTSRTIATVVVL
jgi:hypothetical protein